MNTQLDEWGYIPEFLSLSDPRPAREQFDENYISGWWPFNGFELKPTMQLCYPDDPPMSPIAMMPFREERIFLYPHAWVLIMQKDGSYEVARMD